MRDLVPLLAGAADSSRVTVARARTQLENANLSTAERAALVKAGLTASEKADLIEVLDRGGLSLSPAARSLLEAIVGRDGFMPTRLQPPSQPTPPPPPARQADSSSPGKRGRVGRMSVH